MAVGLACYFCYCRRHARLRFGGARARRLRWLQQEGNGAQSEPLMSGSGNGGGGSGGGSGSNGGGSGGGGEEAEDDCEAGYCGAGCCGAGYCGGDGTHGGDTDDAFGTVACY